METLQHLIGEAVALAGGNLCASGHDWIAEGGRQCPIGLAINCSQAVYRCKRCGEYDYGDIGGPGHADCMATGRHDCQKYQAEPYDFHIDAYINQSFIQPARSINDTF